MTQVVHAEATTAADPETAFAVLADTAGWLTWTKATEAGLLEPAPDPTPEGVGAIRRFQVGRTTSVERVVAYEPGSRFAYELISGLPLVDYHSEVTFTVRPDGGADIAWHSTFEPRHKGTGWIYRMALQRFIGDLVVRLARRAEVAERDA